MIVSNSTYADILVQKAIIERISINAIDISIAEEIGRRYRIKVC